ncbi:MAG: hypothetical protein AB7E60_04590 [Sphingobium sp.]
MPYASPFAFAAPLLVLLASCVGPPQQHAATVPPPGPAAAPRPERPVQSPAPAPAAAPATPAVLSAPAAGEWHNRPATPGNWAYRAEAGGTSALFGTPESEPRLIVRCDRATRRISLIRAGAGQGVMVVRTSYGAQNWPATVTAAPMPQTVAVRAASDGGLDQIAYSRGRFAVEVQGLEPVILPAWAEVARVIEDCRG